MRFFLGYIKTETGKKIVICCGPNENKVYRIMKRYHNGMVEEVNFRSSTEVVMLDSDTKEVE